MSQVKLSEIERNWLTWSSTLRFRLPNQSPPPSPPPRFQGLSKIKAPKPIPIPIPTRKPVTAAQIVGLTKGCRAATGMATGTEIIYKIHLLFAYFDK